MTLGEYLEASGRRVRIAGEHDCATFPANWAIICGHPDPMSAWRGCYDSEAEARGIIDEAGGLAVLFAQGLTDCRRVNEPLAGDIGAIRIGDDEAGAIFTGKRWAFVADRGLAFASVDPAHIAGIWRP